MSKQSRDGGCWQGDVPEGIATTVEDAWSFISEPGWFINEGRLVDHEITWPDEGTVVVADADHGEFTFKVNESQRPERIGFCGLDSD